MRLDRIVNIADLRRLARRRLPRIVRDYMDGGSEDEFAVAGNLGQFRRYRLVPRYFVDITGAATATTLFGRTYGCPIGIAPTGYPGLFRPGGDVLLARAAAAANVPFIMSGAATASVEVLAKAAPGHVWFQLYPAQIDRITEDKIRRAAEAGVEVLVLTVDVVSEPKRERNIRNGFEVPFRYRLSTVIDGALHPAWSLAYFATGGLPRMENWAPYAPEGADAAAIAVLTNDLFHATQTWETLALVRKRWPGKLVIKGIMAADDARRVAAAGADGIIVSNHGGRQGDRLPAPLEVLASVIAAAPHLTVMIDGGVRRGADVVTALGLGARFVFVGRPTLYGLTVAGQAGAEHALAILKEEMLVTMRQLGRPTIPDLDADAVLEVGG
ncbi:MAG: alpha-hydroxy-acid oxidizing protein [Alphaproteobacteria bacterium]|nr:alpha-hydroxy-acid oxidizing protein [Alphaproteobacteria bacterium]